MHDLRAVCASRIDAEEFGSHRWPTEPKLGVNRVGTSAASEATAINAASAPMLECLRLLAAALCGVVVKPVKAICMNFSC